jgi:hypothetical protein
MFKCIKHVVLIAILAMLAVPSLASATDAPQVTNPAQLPDTVMMSIAGSQVKASDLATGKVTVLSDMLLKKGVKVNSKNCFWTKKGQVWYNGGYGANGTQYVKETVSGKLCKSKHSPTGLVKVAGGHTGRRCFNAAKVGKAPGPVVTGRVIWVRSLMKVKVTIKASVSVTAIGHDQVTGQECGRATARASSSLRVRLSSYLKVKGRMNNAAVRFYARIQSKASAKASASVDCGSIIIVVHVPSSPEQPPVPPTTPPAKDGTQTPAPPTTAPGPNPQPSPQDPAPGGHQCYWESVGDYNGVHHASGDPVRQEDLGPNGACPVGSYGGRR